MKYPIITKTIIDVTKAPYFADNTGKTDCTAVLRQVFDDLLQREIDGVKETYARLREMSENGKKNIYDGFENRDDWQGVNVIYPQYAPDARIIYFPAGTYLVSDTITYTFDNLKNILYSKPFFELCRGIRLMGESKESVTIRLADNSKGFEEGTKKPVVSYTIREDFMTVQCSNVAQSNYIEDITIDCGEGNPGAVGIRIHASNTGRIENVSVISKKSYAGIALGRGTEICIENVSCSGFDYGIIIPTTFICTLENVHLENNYISALYSWSSKVFAKNVHHGDLPLITFEEGAGVYYFVGEPDVVIGDTLGNVVHIEKAPVKLRNMNIPKCERSQNPDDWALVDDFGAIGDGKTDSTAAIQAAMNSGKPIIMFGDGHYLVSGEITIPASVKLIDFMFCDFFSAESLTNARGGALFHINEDSDEMLFMENVYTFEQFYGHMRFIKHGAKRDLVMSDLHTQAASMYFNTVKGSKVYINNCAVTTGTYTSNAILLRPTLAPYYCYVVPYEFHGQTVYARLINPERADIEILNDASDILIEGIRAEGPGTIVKTINGGNSEVHTLCNGIGYYCAPTSVFVTEYAHSEIFCASIAGCDDKLDSNWIIEQNTGGVVQFVHREEIPDQRGPHHRIIHHYDSDKLDELI